MDTDTDTDSDSSADIEADTTAAAAAVAVAAGGRLHHPHRLRRRDLSKTTTYILDYQHAKVRGTVLRLADSGERIAVACPFCHRVHLHEPTRHPVSTFVPPGVDPEAEALAYDESTGYAGDVKARPLNVVTWETDRVASCKMGTYHIVGD